MDTLALALAPAVIASIALQQLIELADPFLETWIKRYKKPILSAASLGLALALSLVFGFRMLTPLGMVRSDALDVLVTSLFIAGGVKGFNDLLKWIGYSKEARKAALNADQAQRV
jgi:hypothetical protein